jgi:RND family efflux transporter MFP subunit
VAKGDIIAVLNDDILESRRDLAEAALALTKAQLETNRAEAALAKQALDRMERLRKSAAFSQARYDDAHQQVNIALQRVREAQAMIARAEAELRFNQINLDYTKVSAPYDGVITRRLTETGAYVQVGDPVVFMIADQNLEVEAEVPFERLAGLQEGTAADFTLDDGTHHRAIVRAVLPSENPLTRTRVVRFTPRFNGLISRLANAQSVTVAIPAGAARDVLSVHKDAIIRRLGKTVVYVVVGDKAEARTIEIGEGMGERLEVLSGLEEGEMVVTRGNERLTPGAQVQIDGAS